MITRLYTVHIVRKYASNAKKSEPLFAVVWTVNSCDRLTMEWN